MRRLITTAVALLATLAASAAGAQARQSFLGASLGYADAEVQGLAVTGFYGRAVGFVRPMVYLEGIAHSDPNSRYYRDTFDNGQSRCRDSVTGRFAADANCAAAWQLAARGEVLVRLLKTRVLFGPGARIGEEFAPYGTVMYESQLGPVSVFQVKGSAGAKFIQLDVGAALAF